MFCSLCPAIPSCEAAPPSLIAHAHVLWPCGVHAFLLALSKKRIDQQLPMAQYTKLGGWRTQPCWCPQAGSQSRSLAHGTASFVGPCIAPLDPSPSG